MGRSGRGNGSRVREVRLARLAQILEMGRPISRQDLEDELEVSRATLTRDIETLRDQLNMPIAFDRDQNGYVIANHDVRNGPRYQLPGIWITAAQATAVLALLNVCLSIDPGVVGPTLRPLRSLLKQIAGLPHPPFPSPEDKLSLEFPDIEESKKEVFRALSEAVYKELPVEIELRETSTKMSPTRFALTPEGWFLDGEDLQAGSTRRLAIADIHAVSLSANSHG